MKWGQTNKKTDRLTDRQTDKQTDRQTDRLNPRAKATSIKKHNSIVGRSTVLI